MARSVAVQWHTRNAGNVDSRSTCNDRRAQEAESRRRRVWQCANAPPPDADRDALQLTLATRSADCDALLGAVVDRLRHAVAAPPGAAQGQAEALAAMRATVLQCADDLAHLRDLLLPPERCGALDLRHDA
jgi:hypothetical protein